MNLRPRLLLRFIGAIAVLCAALGIAYNSISLNAIFSKPGDPSEVPFFYSAFLTMSVICLCCYALLIFFGISLLLGHSTAAKPLTTVLLFEVGFFVLIGMSWLLPGVGRESVQPQASPTAA